MGFRRLVAVSVLAAALSAGAQQTIRIYTVGSSSFGQKLVDQIVDLVEASGPYTVETGASGYTRLDQWASGEASYQAWLDEKMPDIMLGNYDYVIVQTISWFNLNPTSQEYLWTQILPDLNQRIQTAGAELILYDKYPSPGCYPDYVRSNNLFHIRACVEAGISKIAWGGTSVEELGLLQYFKDMRTFYDMVGHPGPMMDYLSACAISYMITGVNPIGTSMTNISIIGWCNDWFLGLETSSEPADVAFFNAHKDRVVNAHLQLTAWEADTLQRTAMRNHLAWMDTLAANRDNAARYAATLAEIDSIRALHGQWAILYPGGVPPNVVERCQPLGAAALSEDQLAAIRDTVLMWSDRVEQAAQQYLSSTEYDQLRQAYTDYWLDYNSKFRDDTYYMLLVELELARMDSTPDAAEIARLEQQSVMFREVLSLPAEEMLIDMISASEADAFIAAFTWPSAPNAVYAPQFGAAQLANASQWGEVEVLREMYLDIWQNDDYMDSLRDNSYPLSTWLMVDSIFAARYASFVPGYRTLEVIGSGVCQSITVSPSASAYALGTDVTVSTSTYIGYEFKSWSGDAAGSTHPLTVTMDANKRITANFGFVDDGIILDNDAPFPSVVTSTSGVITRSAGDFANTFGRDVFKLTQSELVRARYTPNINGIAGEYRVFVWYPAGGPTSAVHYVTHDGGVDTIIVDQSVNSGTWFLLGTYDLSPGACVEIDGEHSNGRPYADAVRFLATGGTTPTASAPMQPTQFGLTVRAAQAHGGATVVQYSVPTTLSGYERTRICLYSIAGARLAVLVDGMAASGTHAAVWDGRDSRGYAVSTGFYLLQMRAGEFTASRKVFVAR